MSHQPLTSLLHKSRTCGNHLVHFVQGKLLGITVKLTTVVLGNCYREALSAFSECFLSYLQIAPESHHSYQPSKMYGSRLLPPESVKILVWLWFLPHHLSHMSNCEIIDQFWLEGIISHPIKSGKTSSLN